MGFLGDVANVLTLGASGTGSKAEEEKGVAANADLIRERENRQYVKDQMAQGLNRAKELYGMDTKQIGAETQDVISRYKSRLDDTTEARRQSNAMKAQARANKGANLTTGEQAQLDRQAASDVYSQQSRNLADYRSLIGNIASNTGSLEMGYGNIGVAGQQTPVPSYGGATVICTELKRQKLLPVEVWEADSLYGIKLREKSPETYYGYYVWARYVAKGMSKSKILTNIVKPFALAWAWHISGLKPNFLGGLIEKIGLPLCYMIGKLTYKREKIHG